MHRLLIFNGELCREEDWSGDDGLAGPTCVLAGKLCKDVMECLKRQQFAPASSG